MPGDFPPGRLDFVFFTNSVMSVNKSFIISTEHMNASFLSQNNLFLNDTDASDHLPVVVDFVGPLMYPIGFTEYRSEKDIVRVTDILGRDVEKRKH